MIYKKISLIIPIYNEVNSLNKNIKKIKFFLKKNFEKFEIIIVESGSTDGSKQICEKLAKKHKNIKLITENQKYGFGSALKKGFKYSSGKIITFFTIDYPFDLKHFIKASKLLTKYDCVLSYRINDKRSMFRKIQSYVFNYIAKFLLKLKVRNVNSALKVYKSELIKKFNIESNGWLIDTEINYIIKKKNIKYFEIPVEIKRRELGTSSVKLTTPFIILIELIIFALKKKL